VTKNLVKAKPVKNLSHDIYKQLHSEYIWEHF